MTIQEIKDRIAEISCSIYNGATVDDMKDALDALWYELDDNATQNKAEALMNESKTYQEVLALCKEAPTDNVDVYIDYITSVCKNIIFTFVDEEIDDGCDENEDGDTYVMKRVWDVSYNGYTFVLRLYYGNYSLKVGSFSLK